tara:strand:+ start:38376 stop:39971 length:1596 start_codon:yes stop_codon:yes gene_type:complete
MLHKQKKLSLSRKLGFLFLFISHINLAQFSSITASSIDNNNLKIDLTFDQEIYSNSTCSTLTCIEVTDFILSLSGGDATLASNLPLTITKLGNYDFTNQWNNPPVEPNNSGGNEDWVQHVSTGLLNDLPNSNNLNGVLEIIEPNPRAIPGYTYITSYPIGLSCAHSYYRSTTASSWTSQKLKAQNAGGDLLVYNSPEEFSYMVPGFNDNTTGVGNTWIGLSQDRTALDYLERGIPALQVFPYTNGGWYWDDGTAMDNSAAPLKYQITIALNGIPNGDELVSINPITSPVSIFNCAGISANSQINGTNQVYLIDKLVPFITSTTISDDNTSIRVVFNENIFTDAASNPILITDFTLSLVQNGSTANLTSINPSVVANNGNVFDLLLPMNGLPITGKEVLTVVPSSSTSIFDAASNTASSVQSNNAVTFNPPKTGPVYLSNIYKTSVVSGTIIVGSESFICDEVLVNDYNQIYHDGTVLEPQVGNRVIYNMNYSYPSILVDGFDFAYFHLRDYNKILEIRKSDGLIVSKYSCP